MRLPCASASAAWIRFLSIAANRWSRLNPSAGAGGTPVLPASVDGLSLDQRLAAVEKALIQGALAQAQGNRTHAAKALKIKRTTLLEKMARLGLEAGGAAPRQPKGRRKLRRGGAQH